jgi:chromosomal replication initiation ATPase DnaA
MNTEIIELKKDILKQQLEIAYLKKVLRDRHQMQNVDLTDPNLDRIMELKQAPYFNDMDYVCYQIAKITGIKYGTIKSKSRVAKVVTAKFAVYWTLYDVKNYTLTQIATHFGVHHASILHGIRTFKDRVEVGQMPERELVKQLIKL